MMVNASTQGGNVRLKTEGNTTEQLLPTFLLCAQEYYTSQKGSSLSACISGLYMYHWHNNLTVIEKSQLQ